MLRGSNRPMPSSGGPYVWITEGGTYFSCLSVIKNGTGQGFLAIDTSGNKYWLDHMAQYGEPNYVSAEKGASPERLVVDAGVGQLRGGRALRRYRRPPHAVAPPVPVTR